MILRAEIPVSWRPIWPQDLDVGWLACNMSLEQPSRPDQGTTAGALNGTYVLFDLLSDPQARVTAARPPRDARVTAMRPLWDRRVRPPCDPQLPSVRSPCDLRSGST